jgi:hypothetical protein
MASTAEHHGDETTSGRSKVGKDLTNNNGNGNEGACVRKRYKKVGNKVQLMTLIKRTIDVEMFITEIT